MNMMGSLTRRQIAFGWSRLQTTLANVSALTAARLFNAALTLLTTIYLTRFLSPTTYGALIVASSSALLLTGLLSAGAPQWLLPRLVAHFDYGFLLLINAVRAYVFIALTLYIVLILAFAHLFAVRSPSLAMLLFLLAAWLDVLSRILELLLAREERFRLIASVNVLETLWSNLVTLALLFAGMGIWGFIVAEVTSSFARLVYLIYLTGTAEALFTMRRNPESPPYTELLMMRQVWGAWVMFSLISSVIPILIGRQSTITVAYYSLLMRVTDSVNIILGPIATVLYRNFLSALQVPLTLLSTLRRQMVVLGVAAALPALAIAFLAPLVFPPLFGSRYAEAAGLLRFTSLLVLTVPYSTFFSSAMVALHKDRLLLATAIAAVSGNIGLMLLPTVAADIISVILLLVVMRVVLIAAWTVIVWRDSARLALGAVH